MLNNIILIPTEELELHLMAIMGRTEEQIMVMGNWTSSPAARRHICTSEVTMRENWRSISLADGIIDDSPVTSGKPCEDKASIVEKPRVVEKSIVETCVEVDVFNEGDETAP